MKGKVDNFLYGNWSHLGVQRGADGNGHEIKSSWSENSSLNGMISAT